MAIIGILFDIDALGGGFYGKTAYGILFDSVGRQNIRDVRLYDGDTAATLHLTGAKAPDGNPRLYCIAIESDNEALIRYVEGRLAVSHVHGLCPPEHRFLRDAVALRAEPLVFAGAIDAQGVLVGCDTPWVAGAWSGQVKTTYDVVLKEAGSNKWAIIKEVRAAIADLGLAEAKALVEGAPRTIKAGVTKAEAMEIMRKFEVAGAKVEIR
jgi:large subunit ribosomal protein L7/L12